MAITAPVHLWLRAESRANERRSGLLPDGVHDLIQRGFSVTVEESHQRVFSTQSYRDRGAMIVPEGSWPKAPEDAIILGLKELPDSDVPLRHRHVMFAHAFKQQPGAAAFLSRFRRGGGALFDLEYLTDDTGRRLAAFGYWAGFAGAAISLIALGAQRSHRPMSSISEFSGSAELLAEVQSALGTLQNVRVLIVGAKGRVGGGAAALCSGAGVKVTPWDIEETQHGGPFPEIAAHDVFLNCILAHPGVPVFVPADMAGLPRALRVIGDIACDPGSDYTPIRVNNRITDWQVPLRRVHDHPPLDVMAIDNLPSLLPVESSEDFAAQLLPCLRSIDQLDQGTWGRAGAVFQAARADLSR